jgi:hsp70-interacting protein
MSAGSSSGGGEQWAWLGLLKWTLAHQDGTIPSSESPAIKMMSDEDRAFLEKVMSEGIIDEGERMKFILQEFSKAMEYYKHATSQQGANTTVAAEEKEEQPPAPPNEDDLENLLQELRDIVEQVDFARGFVNLKGCNYLLGAISAMTTTTTTSVPVVPTEIRNMCLGILATLSQNNPPVQKELLELGAIKTLSEIFLLDISATPLSTKTKIMQALSAIVRCYDFTEAIFEQLPQAPFLMVQGLSSDPSVANASLRAKTVFFLRAFLASDNGTPARANKFRHAIAMIADTDSQYLNSGNGDEVVDVVAIQLRESAIALLQQLLERRLAVTLLLQRKQHLASLGIQRIQQLRASVCIFNSVVTSARN